MKKRIMFIGVAIVIAALAFWVGTLIGQSSGYNTGFQSGKVEGQSSYGKIVSAIFPKPQDVRTLNGAVKDVSASSITISVADPNDYLPHPDGSPRSMQIRTVNITSSTTLRLVNYGKVDAYGNPATSVIKLSDIKPGDTVSVTSNQNIINSMTFDASSVNLIKY